MKEAFQWMTQRGRKSFLGQRPTIWKTLHPKTTPDPFHRFVQHSRRRPDGSHGRHCTICLSAIAMLDRLFHLDHSDQPGT